MQKIKYKKLITYTDGGARGNPGPAAIGVVIKDENSNTIKTHKECIGETTNNQAEYKALLKALEIAKDLNADEVACLLDSELVVKQMRQEYKVKDKELAKIFVLVWNLSTQFSKVTYKHIRREFNKEADALVNQALDLECNSG